MRVLILAKCEGGSGAHGKKMGEEGNLAMSSARLTQPMVGVLVPHGNMGCIQPAFHVGNVLVLVRAKNKTRSYQFPFHYYTSTNHSFFAFKVSLIRVEV